MATLSAVSNDDIIRLNMEAFLPYICDCIKLTDILVRIHNFTKEQRKSLFLESTQNNTSACRKALDILMNECDDPGRFVAFKEAMETCRYPVIVKLLEGKYVPFNENCQRVIELFTPMLAPNLNPEEVLNDLVCRGTLHENEAEEVRAEGMNHGRYRACWLLLFHLPNRAENWFRDFMEVLIDARYTEMAEKLEPDMYEKIMAQRRGTENRSNHSTLSLTGEYTIEKEDFEVGEKCSMQLCGAPPPESMSSNGSIATKGGHSDETVGTKGGHSDENVGTKGGKTNFTSKLSDLTLNLKQTDSKSAGKMPVHPFKTPDSQDGDSLTQLKEIAKQQQKKANLEKNGGTKTGIKAQATANGKRIQYDRDFLLSLQDSPLSNNFAKEIEKFKDIILPNTLPRILDTKSRSPQKQENNFEDYVRSVDTIPNRGLLPGGDFKVNNVTLVTQPEICDNDLEYNLTERDGNTDVALNENSVSELKINNVNPETMDTVSDDDNSADEYFDCDGEVESQDQTKGQVPNVSLDFGFLLNEANQDHTDSCNNIDERIKADEELFVSVPDSTLEHAEELHGAVGGHVVNNSTDSVAAPVSLDLNFDELADDLEVDYVRNDLDYEGQNNSYVDGDELDFNISTDNDDIDNVVDVDVELREYQKELAKRGCEGNNVIVMAPTNTGKTRVAFRIMQEHLRMQRQLQRIGRVIFLVENEALASQQGKSCAETLPAYRTKIITGSLQRDKKQFLKDFVDRRDILVVTAQVLLNSLTLKEIPSLMIFSMIVFDECHHTNNNHRFNEIMSRYMDLKLVENADIDLLPQIIGLTASLGVGGNTSEDLAMKHMKEILSNLDAKFLCTVRVNKEELRAFENSPREEIVTARKRRHDPYRDDILQIMDDIDKYMINHRDMATIPKHDDFVKTACRVPPCAGSPQFQQWLSDFAKAIGKVRSSDICCLLNPCREHLEVYNKALMIHADARRKDAEIILEQFMTYQQAIVPKRETDQILLALYDGLKQNDYSTEPENPKLLKLQNIIWDIHGNNEDARGIIFVKTRELADALRHWMNETQPLAILNATQFVGQAASASCGGTTKSRQKDVLEYFKGGRHKIIIATSVAEEGLDITKCNLVIRYEHVTNEIARLQSRGRARAQYSRYYVVTEEGSWIVAKEEKNAVLEKLMNRIIPHLQVYIEDHPNMWEEEIREIQMQNKLVELTKKEERKNKITSDVKELRCFNCNNFICFSTDIRKIQNSHHVIIKEDVKSRLISKRDPHPKFVEDDLQYDGEIFCGNDGCQHTLGGVCTYKHVEFPLISIKHFKVIDQNGKSERFKQWKKANFEPEEFTLENLHEVARRLRARNF